MARRLGARVFGIGSEAGLAFAICMQAVWFVPTTIVGAVILVRTSRRGWQVGAPTAALGPAVGDGVRLKPDTGRVS